MTDTTLPVRRFSKDQVLPAQRRSDRSRRALDAARSLTAGRVRRAEPWRDCVLLGLYIHGVLIAAVLTQAHGVGLLLLGALLSLGLATGTLTVLHDAGHRMFAKAAWPNVLAVQLSVPAGLWVGHWTLKHRMHHKMCEVYPYDESTRSPSILRLHPEAPARPMHRYQHLYAWPLYGLAWAGELRSQLTYLRTGHVALTRTPSGRERLLSFVVEKALWLAVLTPYVWLLGWTRLVVLLLVSETLGSLVAAVITVVGHVNLGLTPIPGPPGRDWMAHLVRTTASFRTDSRIVRFWTGGLTHHLAHHLRPVALRSELPVLHETAVRDLAIASGLPVAEYRTFRSAVVAHYRRLLELGRP